jgi:hypothetical protein
MGRVLGMVTGVSFSVIVADFYVVGIAVFKAKTDTPLVVDGDGKLTFSVPR